MPMITATTWGNRLPESIRGTLRVRVDGHEQPINAVVASIERRTGLTCCAGPCSQGTRLEKGQPCEDHYSLTLGRPINRRRLRDGRTTHDGFSPVCEIWCAVPLGPRAARVEQHEHQVSGSRCDKCGETVTDLDAGFSPGVQGMDHDCGGTWRPCKVQP